LDPASNGLDDAAGMLDLNDFYYFVQVVNRGGFTAASRTLRIPKSTLGAPTDTTARRPLSERRTTHASSEGQATLTAEPVPPPPPSAPGGYARLMRSPLGSFLAIAVTACAGAAHQQVRPPPPDARGAEEAGLDAGRSLNPVARPAAEQGDSINQALFGDASFERRRPPVESIDPCLECCDTNPLCTCLCPDGSRLGHRRSSYGPK
jgi:hypothetical protein